MITKYCQTSTKYTLYSFHKFFIPSKILILLFLIISPLKFFCQESDTLSLKLKKSKLLIVNKIDKVDEWSFEETDENIDSISTNKKINLIFSLGLFRLNSHPIYEGISHINNVPFNQVNSNCQTLTYYFKHLIFAKNKLAISLGTGLNVQRINLGNYSTIYNDSILSFHEDSEFTNQRNVLKYNYWTIPIALTINPLFNKKNHYSAQIELTNYFLRHGKLDIKTIENKNNKRAVTKGDFFQEKRYVSVKVKLIRNSFGIFMETSLMPTSKLFTYQYNYSFGLSLCNYR